MMGTKFGGLSEESDPLLGGREPIPGCPVTEHLLAAAGFRPPAPRDRPPAVRHGQGRRVLLPAGPSRAPLPHQLRELTIRDRLEDLVTGRLAVGSGVHGLPEPGELPVEARRARFWFPSGRCSGTQCHGLKDRLWANASCAGLSNRWRGSRRVATGTGRDSRSGQRTDAFSMGMRWASVCICTRKSNSTSCRASVARHRLAEVVVGRPPRQAGHPAPGSQSGPEGVLHGPAFAEEVRDASPVRGLERAGLGPGPQPLHHPVQEMRVERVDEVEERRALQAGRLQLRVLPDVRAW